MRIVVLPSWYPSAQHPLVGVFVEDQVAALAQRHRDLDMHVVTLAEPAPWLSPGRPAAALRHVGRYLAAPRAVSRRDARGFTVHTMRTLAWTDRAPVSRWQLAASDVAALLRGLTRDGRPVDLLHVHVVEPMGRVARRVAGRLGIPYVVTEHMSPFPFPDLLTPQGTLPAEVLRAVADAAEVIAVSRSHAAQIAASTGRAPIVVPNGCDERAFSAATRADGDGGFELLMVGGLIPQKGVDVLLRALARARGDAPDLRLSIAGDGIERDALKALATSLGLDDAVRWLGPVGRQRMPALFQGADAFVLASRWESFGVVLIEAMASGLPLVATDCGGPADIVDDATGLLVPPDDVDALAAALVRVRRERDRFDRRIIRQRFLDRFSFDVVTARLRTVYERAVRAGDGPATDPLDALGAASAVGPRRAVSSS